MLLVLSQVLQDPSSMPCLGPLQSLQPIEMLLYIHLQRLICNPVLRRPQRTGSDMKGLMQPTPFLTYILLSLTHATPVDKIFMRTHFLKKKPLLQKMLLLQACSYCQLRKF
jgi:hypothetical protein